MFFKKKLPETSEIENLIKEQKYFLSETEIPNITFIGFVNVVIFKDTFQLLWNPGQYINYENDLIHRVRAEIKKEDIISVSVILNPDITLLFNETYDAFSTRHFSEFKIIHKDPFGIVPNFKTVIRHSQSYWIKALTVYCESNFGLKCQVTENNKTINP